MKNFGLEYKQQIPVPVDTLYRLRHYDDDDDVLAEIDTDDALQASSQAFSGNKKVATKLKVNKKTKVNSTQTK